MLPYEGLFIPTLETHSALNIDGGPSVGKQIACKPILLGSLALFRRQRLCAVAASWAEACGLYYLG